MKKIWTLTQIARALEITRQRADALWRQGRLPHDIEDQAGTPYWSRVPRKPEALRPGRKRD